MENELGISLFKRDRHKIMLTPAGEYLRKAFEDLLKEYNSSLTKARELHAGQFDSLHVGLPEGLSFLSLTTTTRKFVTKYPDILLKLEYTSFSEMRNKILSEAMDVVITFGATIQHHPEFECTEICSSPCCLVISKEHRLYRRPTLKAKDFDNEKFYMLPDEEFPSARQFWENTLSYYEITPSNLFFLPNASSMLLSIKNGNGVALLDKYSNFNIFNNPNEFMYFELSDAAHTLVAAKKRGNLNPLVGEFVNTLILETKKA
jgi:DNA-binding transcriptional LysR family regulator